MRFARWITKATDTHTIFNSYFLRQQLLRERTTILRYMYIVQINVDAAKCNVLSIK